LRVQARQRWPPPLRAPGAAWPHAPDARRHGVAFLPLTSGLSSACRSLSS
jgi:hypothetical protein